MEDEIIKNAFILNEVVVDKTTAINAANSIMEDGQVNEIIKKLKTNLDPRAFGEDFLLSNISPVDNFEKTSEIKDIIYKSILYINKNIQYMTSINNFVLQNPQFGKLVIRSRSYTNPIDKFLHMFANSAKLKIMSNIKDNQEILIKEIIKSSITEIKDSEFEKFRQTSLHDHYEIIYDLKFVDNDDYVKMEIDEGLDHIIRRNFVLNDYLTKHLEIIPYKHDSPTPKEIDKYIEDTNSKITTHIDEIIGKITKFFNDDIDTIVQNIIENITKVSIERIKSVEESNTYKIMVETIRQIYSQIIKEDH